MAPAFETQQNLQLQTLAKSFEALLLTAHGLSRREKGLQRRLKYAHDEYSKLANQLPGGSDTHTKIVAEKILRCPPEPIPHEHPLKAPDVVNTLAESGHVGEPVVTVLREGLDCYQSVSRPPDDNLLAHPDPCVVATRAGTPNRLEKDFTTKGMQGSLRCPFTKQNNEDGAINGFEDAFKFQNGDTCGHGSIDPIKAEKAEQNERRSSQTGSMRSSAARCPISRCPIRFMDQHTPEEVADYVERHKHEIPRSHAICVSRYQKTPQSMRQLDAKYGSLISMIQGLSVKHQAFLPNAQNGVPSTSSAEQVEKWADDVRQTPRQDMHPAIKEEDEEGHYQEERKGHFDRPLREIRVGESPSRPWGIPVPLPLDAPPVSPPQSAAAPVARSKKPSDNAHDASVAALRQATPDETDVPALPRRCPFGHGAPAPAPPPKLEPETEAVRNDETEGKAAETPRNPGGLPDGLPQPDPNAPPATIIFNGPVFFGYPPEQTAFFMQQLGNLRKPS